MDTIDIEPKSIHIGMDLLTTRSEINSDNNNNNNGKDVQAHGDKSQSNCDLSSQAQPPRGRHEQSREYYCQQAEQQQSQQLVSVAAHEESKIYQSKIKELRRSGEGLRSDRKQPSLLHQKPSWFDEQLFENAKSVYERHFMGVNFAHLSGLLLLVRVNSIYRTLSSTGKSDSVAKLFRRYYQTVIHVKKWYEGDIFDETSEAHRSLLIVRGMHNKVSSDLNNSMNTTTNYEEDDQRRTTHKRQVHISEYDIMLTQFAFIGFIVTRAKFVGLIEDFSEHDLASMLHFWRVIGHYLGASDTYNLCSRDLAGVRGLCDAILECEFRQSILNNPVSSSPGIMGVNIVRSIKFIPMLTIYGITKYLYELIDLDTQEFEARATWYSHLSYKLMKLVMTNLLAYKGFRWFNNGLTRLSVYLVGKIEDFFARHLDSKYGHELKL